MTDPFNEMDDEAQGSISRLMNDNRHAALAFTDPRLGTPAISMVAFGRDPDGAPMSLMSDLSTHAAALKVKPDCALLIGVPGDRGDPLTHPRLSLRVRAEMVRHGDPRHGRLAARYLQQQPKAKLYINFADFSLVIFDVLDGLYNGGFGKAYKLLPEHVQNA